MTAVRETEPWQQLLATGREDERLVHDETYEARPQRTVAIPDDLDWRVVQALREAGIEELYEHQREALLRAFDGAGGPPAEQQEEPSRAKKETRQAGSARPRKRRK